MQGVPGLRFLRLHVNLGRDFLKQISFVTFLRGHLQVSLILRWLYVHNYTKHLIIFWKKILKCLFCSRNLIYYSYLPSLVISLTLETLWTLAPQAPQSMEFSRQEHWSGLPFPSPVHESEKWKWSRSVMSDSSWPHGPQPPRLLCPWDFPGKSTGVGCRCFLRSLTLETLWTLTLQAPLSMEFSRQEYWSGLSRPPPEPSFLTQRSNLCLLH